MALLKRREGETIDDYYERLREKSDREDIVMFVNTCFAATRQNEFYTHRYEQSVSIDFLHHYVMANFRRLYARSTAAGINHFNQAMIVFNLLATGAPVDAGQRAEEGELIASVLRGLPANRSYALISRLQKSRINNRRTRAVIRRFLKSRREPAFDAIKYRKHYKAAAAHAHLDLGNELGPFLFGLERRKKFETELLDKYRQAHYSASAIYDLPFTIAQSLAAKHGIPMETFFQKIQPKMTQAEKLRFQVTADRAKGVDLGFDLAKAPLTKLAIYVLSLPPGQRQERADELHAALQQSAGRAAARIPMRLGNVVAILDRSRSAMGSRQKRNRPHAVAVATSYLLRELASEYREIWTPQSGSNSSGFAISQPAAGQTSLADPLIDALQGFPDLVVMVSDGFENDPPDAADQVAKVFRQKIGRSRTPEIIHLNPVFDADHFSPRPIGKTITTVGVRDAEDIPTMLGFARFANGTSSLSELEDYLAFRMKHRLGKYES